MDFPLQETPLLKDVEDVAHGVSKPVQAEGRGLSDASYGALAATNAVQPSTEFANPGYGTQCSVDAYQRNLVSSAASFVFAPFFGAVPLLRASIVPTK